MINIIFIILIFLIGFGCGGLCGVKQSEKINEEWFLLAEKLNNDWLEYCETLIDEIKTLKGSDTE